MGGSQAGSWDGKVEVGSSDDRVEMETEINCNILLADNWEIFTLCNCGIVKLFQIIVIHSFHLIYLIKFFKNLNLSTAFHKPSKPYSLTFHENLIIN